MMDSNNNNNNKKKKRRGVSRNSMASRTRSSSSSSSSGSKKKRKVAADDAVVPSLLMALPKPIRVSILNYLGDTQDELRTLTLVSKQVKKDCKEPGIEWDLIPVFELTPLKHRGVGSTSNFVEKLDTYQRDDNSNVKLQRYRHMIVKDVHKFNEFRDIHTNLRYGGFRTGFQMTGIESLDISSPSLITKFSYQLSGISRVLPNLRELDATNVNMICGYILEKFTNNCPRLEKITWNNHMGADFPADMEGSENGSLGFTSINLEGNNMQSADNLKEIIMDNCCFGCDRGSYEEMKKWSDCNTHPAIFFFCECCKVLERVSIRKAIYHNGEENLRKKLPQEALIKFARNAPSTLKWFRSDLSQENMSMLKKERPGIEFVN